MNLVLFETVRPRKVCCRTGRTFKIFQSSVAHIIEINFHFIDIMLSNLELFEFSNLLESVSFHFSPHLKNMIFRAVLKYNFSLQCGFVQILGTALAVFSRETVYRLFRFALLIIKFGHAMLHTNSIWSRKLWFIWLKWKTVFRSSEVRVRIWIICVS